MSEPEALDPSGVRNVRAVVAYDGTDFAGFQIQRGRETVQGVLQAAIERISQQPVRLVAGGRTDAGVHAVGQVISFRIAWRRRWEELASGLNALLPSTVAIQELGPASDGFHARFSAVGRHYRYTVLERRMRAPLSERYALRVPRGLDVGAMQRAEADLVGRRDFRALGDPPVGDNHVRTVSRAEWAVSGEWLTFDIVADAFLRGMVRRAVGAMLRVGQGAMSAEELAAALDRGDRRAIGPPADPRGLCLMAVLYASDGLGGAVGTEQGAVG